MTKRKTKPTDLPSGLDRRAGELASGGQDGMQAGNRGSAGQLSESRRKEAQLTCDVASIKKLLLRPEADMTQSGKHYSVKVRAAAADVLAAEARPAQPEQIATIAEAISSVYPSQIKDDRALAIQASTWQVALEGIPMVSLQRGFKELVQSDRTFAPVPGEFRAMCLKHAVFTRILASKARRWADGDFD